MERLLISNYIAFIFKLIFVILQKKIGQKNLQKNSNKLHFIE